jgi:hypothetical protein
MHTHVGCSGWFYSHGAEFFIRASTHEQRLVRIGSPVQKYYKVAGTPGKKMGGFFSFSAERSLYLGTTKGYH